MGCQDNRGCNKILMADGHFLHIFCVCVRVCVYIYNKYIIEKEIQGG